MRSVEAIDHHGLELGRVNAILLVRTLGRCAVVARRTEANLAQSSGLGGADSAR